MKVSVFRLVPAFQFNIMLMIFLLNVFSLALPPILPLIKLVNAKLNAHKHITVIPRQENVKIAHKVANIALETIAQAA